MRGRFLLAILLAYGAAMFPAAAQSAERVGDVWVSVEPIPNPDNRGGENRGTEHGYVEYRVQLRNESASEQIVYLSYPERRPGSGGVEATRAVRIAKGQEVSVSLYRPPLPASGQGLQVRVEGVEKPKVLSVPDLYRPNYSPYRYGYGSEPATPTVVLLSRSVPQDFCDPAVAAKSSAGSSPGYPTPPAPMPEAPAGASPPVKPLPPSEYEPSPTDFTFLRSETPVNRWSSNWLGYSCYDAIVLTEQEAGEMPPQAQLAIRRFVECGGSLFIHGARVPAAFSGGGFSDGKQSYRVGFGQVVATLAERNNKKEWRQTYAVLVKSRIYVYNPKTNPGSGSQLLISESKVPVKGLFLLVLVFGLGIGPANLWLLTRRKRRIWLWWNVPVISLFTCLLVFGYSVASEGWTGQEKNASFTLLDERCHRATTLGYLSYYCPLTPSLGPLFGVETDAVLLQRPAQGYQRYNEEMNTTKNVDWTNGQQLGSGWVSARVATYFQIRKNEDRRERLTVERLADGKLKVVNALGADIKRLFVADASGRVFEGRDIPAGAEQTLSVAPGVVQVVGNRSPGGLQSVFHTELISSISRLNTVANPTDLLIPGSYIAFLDQSPFLETTMPGVQSEDTAAVVFGISKGQP